MIVISKICEISTTKYLVLHFGHKKPHSVVHAWGRVAGKMLSRIGPVSAGWQPAE